MMEQRVPSGPSTAASSGGGRRLGPAAPVWSAWGWRFCVGTVRSLVRALGSSLRLVGTEVADGPPDAQPSVREPVRDCERACAEAMELARSATSGERFRLEAQRLRARLGGLERRFTEVASSTGDQRARQRLDDIAGMAISLRGALDAACRLSDAAPAHFAVRAAALDLVILRAEDLDAALRTFEGGRRDR